MTIRMSPLLVSACVLAVACPSKASRHPNTTNTALTGGTSGDTGSTATDTDTDTDTDTTAPWGELVAPWSIHRLNFDTERDWDQYYGDTNYLNDIQAMPDITGDGKPDLASHRVGPTQIRSGLPPSGEADLRDGLFSEVFDVDGRPLSYAGDLNNDGIGDVWYRDCLHYGPFDATDPAGDLCLNIYSVNKAATFGNIDADGDGVLDVVMTDSIGWLGVAYGPFDGSRAVDDPRHAENTTFGPRGFCGSQNDSSYLGSANDLTERLVAVSGFTDCPPVVVNVAGPRGRYIPTSDIVTGLVTDLQPPVRNLRLDGLVDVAMGGKLLDDMAAFAEGGPLQSVFSDDSLAGGIRDLTGDGRDEMVSLRRVERPPDGTEDWFWYVVPGRADLERVDATALGVTLGGAHDHGCGSFTSIDLDGDGLAEFIGYGINVMVIWRGVDIRDALLAAGKLPVELTR